MDIRYRLFDQMSINVTRAVLIIFSRCILRVDAWLHQVKTCIGLKPIARLQWSTDPHGRKGKGAPSQLYN